MTTATGSTDDPARSTVAAVRVISLPLIKQWFAKTYANDQWTSHAQAMVVGAIAVYAHYYNVAILTRGTEIERAKAAGREVKLRVDVDTEWVDTDYGPSQIAAKVSFFSVVLAGETVPDRPLDHRGFWASLFSPATVTKRRNTYFLPI